jgi:hypothetical protein
LAAPKVLLNLSSITNFDMKPQIHKACILLIESKFAVGIVSASCKRTSTTKVAEKG